MKKLIFTIVLSFVFFATTLAAASAQPATSVGPGSSLPTPTPAPPGAATPTPPPPTTGPLPSAAPVAGITLAPTATPPPPRTPRSSGPALNFGVIQNQAGLGTLGGIVSAFVPYVLGAAGIALFLYVIWGGFTIMISRGDPKATAAGKDIITRAIIGFVIIFAAYWLVQLLGLMLGISQFKNIFQ